MKKEILTIVAIFVALNVLAMISKHSKARTDNLLKEKEIVLNPKTQEPPEELLQYPEEVNKENSETAAVVNELRSGKSVWKLIENEDVVLNMSIGNLLDTETGKVVEGKTSTLSVSCNKVDGSLATMLKINGFTPEIDGDGYATVVYTTNVDGNNVKEAQGWTNDNLTGNQNLIGTNASNYAIEMLNKDLITFGTKINANKYILASFNLNGYDETVEPVFKACKISY